MVGWGGVRCDGVMVVRVGWWVDTLFKFPSSNFAYLGVQYNCIIYCSMRQLKMIFPQCPKYLTSKHDTGFLHFI